MSDTPRKKKPAAAAADTAALEARLEALRAEIDEIQASLAGKAEKKAEAAAAINEDVLKEARQALRKIHEQASGLEETLGVQTREKPLQTLLVAFGAGFVVSLLLRR